MLYIRLSFFDVLVFLSYPAPTKTCPVTLDLAFVVDARLVLSDGEFAGHSLDKRLLQLEVSTGNFSDDLTRG